MNMRILKVAFADAFTVAALVMLTACAAGPRRTPIKGADVQTGSGSLTAMRQSLEGSWTLVRIEEYEANGTPRPIPAKGTLTYDDFGNLTIDGELTDPAGNQARMPLTFKGRIVIDAAKGLIYPQDVEGTTEPFAKELAAVSPDKVRKYSIEGNDLTITYLDKAGKPTATTAWKRNAQP